MGEEVKAAFENLKETVSPDLIFTHQRHDAHQDHRLLCELTWNTFRNHFILEYEIPKYDGDLGQPSVFSPLEVSQYQTKVRHLMEVFGSQRSKHWFQESTFEALMRLPRHGMQCAQRIRRSLLLQESGALKQSRVDTNPPSSVVTNYRADRSNSKRKGRTK